MFPYSQSTQQSSRGKTITLASFISALTLALLSLSCGTSQVELLSQAASLEKRFAAKLQPAVRTWVDDQAKKLARFATEEDSVLKAMQSRYAGQDLGDDGREVLMFLATARAVDFTNQQGRIYEDQLTAIRVTTEKMKEVLPRLETDLEKHADLHDLAPIPADCAWYQEELRKIAGLMEKTPSWTTFVPRDGVSISGLRGLVEELKGKLDGLNEMSEMTSLRLQMTMDRRSKFISTLSSMMKKISTTQDTLVQNLK